ncbi:WhiB family transcriptional regulator [Streptomyces sp. NPDC004838]
MTGPAEWSTDALCARTDPELFHPKSGDRGLPAMRICRACPVREPCLDYALKHPEVGGIWGGLTARARGRIRQQQATRRHTP